MCSGYALKRHKYDGGRFYALRRVSVEDDFVDDIKSRGDPNGILSMSVRSIRAIDRLGLRYAVTHSLARHLSDKILLLEFKTRGTAWRVAAFWAEKTEHHDSVAVLIDAFKGHSGKRAHIPTRTIQGLEGKALIAEKLVEKERKNGNL